MRFGWFRRHPLGTALLLSLTVHLALMWDGDLTALTELLQPDDPDQVLEKKKAKTVPKVKLNVQQRPKPAAAAGVPRVTISFIEPPPPAASLPKPVPPAPKPAPKVERERPAANKPADAANAALAATAPSPAAPPVSQPPAAAPAPEPPPVASAPPAPPAPKYEPPPAFPSELQAQYRTAVEGIRATVQQVWRMEGYQYSIENTSSFVGFKFRMSTEGEITPEGILKPYQYRLMMNKKVLRFADFDYATETLRYGKPDNPRQVRITENIYDHLSMAYQLATSFTGEPMIMYFTTGASFSLVDLSLSGEETLKLPGGVLKTLHVTGKSRDRTPFEVDIWLAPELRNFPAKVRIVRKSESVELSLKSLAFEGQAKFGKNVKTEEDEDSAVPAEWLDRPDFKQYQQEQPKSGLPGEDVP